MKEDRLPVTLSSGLYIGKQIPRQKSNFFVWYEVTYFRYGEDVYFQQQMG